MMNINKQSPINYQNLRYDRYTVGTPRIDAGTNLTEVIIDSVASFLEESDTLCIAESVIAITQNRAYKIADITPGFTARLLSHYVSKTPSGIGLGMPETMQLAVEELGYVRLYLAAIVGGFTKLFGRRGDFYRIAGEQARGIDGPTANTLPPYNKYATLLPKNPREVRDRLQTNLTRELGFAVTVVIVDANDIGVNVLAPANGAQAQLGEALCADNPMGQGHEQTPLLVARAASSQAQ